MPAACTPAIAGSAFPRRTRAQLEELLNGTHPQTLADLFQEGFGNYSTTRASIPYTLSVENVGASPRCLYLPYGLTAESVDPESMEYVEDGFLQSPRFSAAPAAMRWRPGAGPIL